LNEADIAGEAGCQKVLNIFVELEPISAHMCLESKMQSPWSTVPSPECVFLNGATKPPPSPVFAQYV
jgi:hypothetical protein